ncbi:MAG: tyrosine-type recombinase/integrase [SAR202 cluster bacterium]|jgi:site-specific recombinase XerD|nr:tyrosine-type recombinase/integrase [SAR202 cluster bacterium]
MRDLVDDGRDLAQLLHDFFLDQLIRRRSVSKCTVASYRDTFKLLLSYVASRLSRKPADLALPDLDAPVVLGFLDHLESERGNSIRTRNVRLAAIHSFMHFAAYRTVVDLPTVRSVLAIPMKRFERGPVDHLSRNEIQALLNAADQSTWSGKRDWILFQTLYNTGARVSEVTAVNIADVDLGDIPQVHIHGKGRKQRVVPLWPETRTGIRRWLVHLAGSGDAPLFPGRSGARLSRSGVSSRLKVLVARAAAKCPSLQRHRISPHLIRHSTATHLLQSGVDLSVIAMWLGHESLETTHQYMEADLTLKRKALESIESPEHGTRRFRPDDRLLRFLQAL